MGFYLSLFVFISSLIIGLALMIVAKGMRRDKFILLASIHSIFLLAFFASLILKKDSTIVVNNYFFTAFICSGLILSGISWRSNAPKPLRIYFTLFALTIPIFLMSPSILLNFLLTTNFSSTNGPVYHIEGKYYLEMQNTTHLEGNIPVYKIITKKGIFHKTIQRDITFGGKIDSVHLLEFEKGKNIILRGYTSQSTFVSTDIDSADVTISLVNKRPGSVEYRL